MGGWGSGRYGGRPTVDASLRIELPHLRRTGYFKVGHRVSGVLSWSRGGETVGRVSVACRLDPEGESTLEVDFSHDGTPVSQSIRLEAVPMRFGGYRWFARCPFTYRRCTTLVLPNGGNRFASVKAWRLSYGSQREDDFGRAHRRIAKAEARLARLSRYARRPTRERLWARIEDGESVLDDGLALAYARFARLERVD